MCCSDPALYASQFGLDAVCEAKPRCNATPTQPVLAIRMTDAGGRAPVPQRLVPASPTGRTVATA